MDVAYGVIACRMKSIPFSSGAGIVAANREFLISLIRLGKSDVVLAEKVLGTCMGRGQDNYLCSESIHPVAGRKHINLLYIYQFYNFDTFLEQSMSYNYGNNFVQTLNAAFSVITFLVEN